VRALDCGRFLGVLILVPGSSFVGPHSWRLFLGVLFLDSRFLDLCFGRFLDVLILVPGCFPGRFVLGSSFFALRVLGVLKALGVSATIGRYAASGCLALLVAG
jgi:hypothetical protein